MIFSTGFAPPFDLIFSLTLRISCCLLVWGSGFLIFFKLLLKEDFKNGALKFGGKEDNIIRAKSNLKFVYADEIKKIEEEAEKDCILNAPLPQYTNPHNSKPTISQRMKTLFEDAKRTQEKIDPYLVADYIDFINLVQKIHAEVENISPENILASEKLTAYFIWALRLKVSQYNHFNPKKFEL